MASIKFSVLTNSSNSSIYVRLSVNRNINYRILTGLSIDSKLWSKKTGFPTKNNSAVNKNLTTDLQKLETFVLERLNKANKSGNEINKDWLKHTIDIHFNRATENNESDLIVDVIKDIIDNAETRKNSKGDIGLSKSRINGYISLKNIITEYQIYQKGKSYKIKDVNVKFGNQLLTYLTKIRNYQSSTSLKKLADLKTVCNEAYKNGIEVDMQFKSINSAKGNNETIIYLSPQELERIEQADITNEALLNARKWLLLGCNLGQRGGDLLNLTDNNFVTRNGYQVIELKQEKTNKNITIPVLEKTKQILETGLPYKISQQKFNEYLKVICRQADINEKIEASKIQIVEIEKGIKENRKIKGKYPKFELISSHVCRRSFATNLYGTLPTPLIMQITGHTTEKMLLNYIGKSSMDYAQQIADFYALQSIKEKKEPQLTIVKKAK